MKPQSQVLNESQLELLPELEALSKNFYMAGGTALSLQIGHRTSLDFDFYSISHFNNLKLINDLTKKFGRNIKVSKNQPKDTLFAEIIGVKTSFFYYPYKVLDKYSQYQLIKLASISDISAMKVAAIVQRGKKRDFIDIYYLIKNLGLKKILEGTYEKYPWYKNMTEIIYRSLTYFSDAEKEVVERGIEVFDKNFSWEEAKRKILEEVKKYQLGMIKK